MPLGALIAKISGSSPPGKRPPVSFGCTQNCCFPSCPGGASRDTVVANVRPSGGLNLAANSGSCIEGAAGPRFWTETGSVGSSSITALFTLPYDRWHPYTSFWKRSDAEPKPYTRRLSMRRAFVSAIVEGPSCSAGGAVARTGRHQTFL